MRKRTKKAGRAARRYAVSSVTADACALGAAITMADLGGDRLLFSPVTAITPDLQAVPESLVRWINVRGLGDPRRIAQLCSAFSVHALTTEDILDTAQRPKVDDYGHYLYVEIDAHAYQGDALIKAQVSLVLGRNFVLSFSEGDTDLFEPLRTRLANTERGRRMSASQLGYALLDAVVDNDFFVLEQISEHVEQLEDRLLDEHDPELIQSLQGLRRQLLLMHKSAWPLRQVVSQLLRTDSDLIDAQLGPYFHDLYDHVAQVFDTAETLRDVLATLQDLHLSSTSNRMNEIMKVLAIISTVFMPLSFLAGLYGMNFIHMPELAQPWAYPAVLLLMALIAFAMYRYFKRKKWM